MWFQEECEINLWKDLSNYHNTFKVRVLNHYNEQKSKRH